LLDYGDLFFERCEVIAVFDSLIAFLLFSGFLGFVWDHLRSEREKIYLSTLKNVYIFLSTGFLIIIVVKFEVITSNSF
jgi:hypothetical protein